VNEEYIRVVDCEIELTERLLGTVPKDASIYASYIKTKRSTNPDAPENLRPSETGHLEQVTDDNEEQTVEDIEEKGWTGFHKDSDGYLFVYDYFIKGFLKHAGNIMKGAVKVRNLKSKIDEHLFVFPRKIRLGDKVDPDGEFERPLRAQTPKGQRVSLARSDYVEKGTTLKFQLTILRHHELSDRVIQEVLSYGELKGLGQFRNGSFGRFKVTKYNVNKSKAKSKIIFEKVA
jgi:hypothetical protein